MAKNVAITVAPGDGIGPEIMSATLQILKAAGARLDYEQIEVGEKIYRDGQSSGIGPEAWKSLQRTGVLLKGPITTPQGGGVKSLNVTIRKSLGLFANVRPIRAFEPFIKTNHPHMDVVVIRENEEDLYAGIEHRQTEEVFQALKLISKPGSERIIRFAFEYAQRRGRKKVACFTKDNIMKLTDGFFHYMFREIGSEYPNIETEHLIVDIGIARLAALPELFDVVVVPNLYGDIVSDVTAELSGSVGLGASANIGEKAAMFEAIHGSAPQIAGKNLANPSGLILAAVSMLLHVGQGDIAQIINNAWLKTIEDGIHTNDIFSKVRSRKQAGTKEFGEAVVERLGRQPEMLHPVQFKADRPIIIKYERGKPAVRKLVGVDVFIHSHDEVDDIAAVLKRAENGTLTLQAISNRGIKVWPDGFPGILYTDHWRCRFLPAREGTEVTNKDIVSLIERLDENHVDFIQTENLYYFDDVRGFSLDQG